MKEVDVSLQDLIDDKTGSIVAMVCKNCEGFEDHEKQDSGEWKCLWCGVVINKNYRSNKKEGINGEFFNFIK